MRGRRSCARDQIAAASDQVLRQSRSRRCRLPDRGGWARCRRPPVGRCRRESHSAVNRVMQSLPAIGRDCVRAVAVAASSLVKIRLLSGCSRPLQTKPKWQVSPKTGIFCETHTLLRRQQAPGIDACCPPIQWRRRAAGRGTGTQGPRFLALYTSVKRYSHVPADDRKVANLSGKCWQPEIEIN
jgi:hypothetical protein